MWIIDRCVSRSLHRAGFVLARTVCVCSLALRVGNEKDDDEADTVGCCSLRAEHMSFPADGHVELNFLGKDSMPYHQVISKYAHILHAR